MSQEYSFSLPYEAFDLELIGLTPGDVVEPQFAEKVTAFFAEQFAQFGGKARVVLNDIERTIKVTWTKDPGFKDPRERAFALLRSGKMPEAISLLWTLQHQHPNDIEVLYNLGVAHSELGQFPKAIEILTRVVEVDSNHVHGLVGLGVAHIRLKQLPSGETFLRRALSIEPRNEWALRNLGACLLKQGRAEEAITVLTHATSVSPDDLQSIIGLGQALEEVGRIEVADEQYVRAIQIGGPQELLDFAKERRTAIAAQTMRDRGEFRPDVMMYITGALEKFESMSKGQIQSLGFEIAMLGQNGLDINNPDHKYSLRSLPGKFSGLHLCSIMYAAFKQFAPEEDVGIDFSKEYETALSMRGK